MAKQNDNTILIALSIGAAILGLNYLANKNKPTPQVGAIGNVDYEQLRYILLSNIDGSEYGVTFNNEKDRWSFLINTFKKEYGNSAIKNVGFKKALSEYIQGQPFCINISILNEDAILLAKRIGILKENSTQKENNKFLNNYFSFLATNIINFSKEAGVNI